MNPHQSIPPDADACQATSRRSATSMLLFAGAGLCVAVAWMLSILYVRTGSPVSVPAAPASCPPPVCQCSCVVPAPVVVYSENPAGSASARGAKQQTIIQKPKPSTTDPIPSAGPKPATPAAPPASETHK